jgi:hypothetical protein
MIEIKKKDIKLQVSIKVNFRFLFRRRRSALEENKYNTAYSKCVIQRVAEHYLLLFIG